MNIQFENDEEQTLIGSFKNSGQIDSCEPIENTNFYQRGHESLEDDDQKEIVHTIEYGDTLEGLSLTYNVSISDIKNRNKIDCDTIYYLKTLIIPNPKSKPSLKEKEEFMKVEEFMQYMNPIEREIKAARYYLSENGWDVAQAVSEYRQDLQWESMHGGHNKSSALAEFGRKHQLKSNEYEMETFHDAKENKKYV